MSNRLQYTMTRRPGRSGFPILLTAVALFAVAFAAAWTIVSGVVWLGLCVIAGFDLDFGEVVGIALVIAVARSEVKVNS